MTLPAFRIIGEDDEFYVRAENEDAAFDRLKARFGEMSRELVIIVPVADCEVSDSIVFL